MTDDPIPIDALAPVFCALVASVVMVGALLSDFGPARAGDPPPLNRPIARAGEWVTTPAGRSVCRLTTDVTRGMTFTRTMCTNWNGGPPAEGEVVPFLRRWPGGGQIMIEGEWRP